MKVNSYINKVDSFIEKNHKKIIVAIIGIQAFLFLIFFMRFGVVPTNDSSSYYEPAIDFIKNGTMCDSSGPTLIRTPGYILFLSLIYVITNYSNNAVVIIQIVMAMTITYLIYKLVSHLSNKKSLGCIASLFYIFDLAVYENALSIITDTLFPFLVILSFYFFIKYLETKKYIHVFICFLCLNYALAVRPQILYYNMILNIVLLILCLFKKINFKVLLTYVLMFSIIFGGWSYRNNVQFSKFDYVPLRSRDYFVFYAPYIYQEKTGVSYKEAYNYFEEILYSDVPIFDELETGDQIDSMARIGKEYVSQNMGTFILVNFKGLFLEMIGPSMSFINKMGLPNVFKLLIAATCSGMLLLSYLVYAFCFLRTLFKQKWLDWTILLTVMYFMTSTAVVGYSRYRLAFYALCLIGSFTCYKQTGGKINGKR